MGKNYNANEAARMPLGTQGLDDRISDRLATALALGRVAVRMAIDTPCVPVLLDERRARIERVAALRAEEMSRVPLGAARYNDLPFDGRLARLAARREALVEIQMAVEPRTLVRTVLLLELRHFLRRVPARQEGDVVAVQAGADAVAARGVLCAGFRVEGDAFQLLAALVAAEAFGVETAPAGRHDTPGDGERALCALCAGSDGCWCPVGTG